MSSPTRSTEVLEEAVTIYCCVACGDRSFISNPHEHYVGSGPQGDPETSYHEREPIVLGDVAALLKQGAEEERERLKAVLAKKRDELNEGARRHPGTHTAREFTAEARAFGWTINHLAALDTLDPSGEEKCENCGGQGGYVGGDAPHDETPIREVCEECDGTGKKPISDPSGEEKPREAVEQAWEESGRSALDELFEAITPRDGSEGDLFAAAMLAPHAWAEIKRLRSHPSGEQGEEKRDYLVSVVHAINHSGAVVDAAVKRFEQAREGGASERHALSCALDAAVFVARTAEPDWTAPSAATWLRERLDEHGQEAAPIGTQEQLDRLTKECPECEADDSGGGVDEPPSAMSTCTNCVGGRVPATDTSKEERPRTYTTEQARMRLRKTLATSEPPQNGTGEEYFIRAAFPDDPASSKEVGGE